MIVEVPLRWSDLDAQAHVNNATTIELLQEARVGFFTGALRDMLADGVVVTAHSVTFLRPIEYADEPVRAEVSVGSIGGARFDIDYRLEHQRHECVRARTTLCPFDFTAGRPRRLTGDERSLLADALVAVDAPVPLPRRELDAAAHGIDLRVRWSDQDRYGHVNNVHYADYIQQGRVAMITGLDDSLMRMGTDAAQYRWMIARQDVQFVEQMAFRDEPYRVRTGVVEIGRTSLKLCADIIDGAVVECESDSAGVLGTRPGARPLTYARAQTVVVVADATGKPTPVPESWRDALPLCRAF